MPAAPLRLALPAGSASPEVPSSDRPPAEALPAGGAGLARWDAVEIARELVVRGAVDSISASTVRRWLRAAALQPWRHRSWIFPRDPQFAVTGGRVVDLYQRIWDGRELTNAEFVVCADEKISIQPRPVGTARCPPQRIDRSGSSTNTSGSARWPISPATTRTGAP